MRSDCKEKCPLLRGLNAGPLISGRLNAFSPGSYYAVARQMSEKIQDICDQSEKCPGPIPSSNLYKKDLFDKILFVFETLFDSKLRANQSDLFVRTEYLCGLKNNQNLSSGD
jgi:hypothetical protein